MDVTLLIKRRKAYVASLVKYRIIINGKELCQLKDGGLFQTKVSANPTSLRVSVWGNSLAVHKMEKEILLWPQYCERGQINCVIKTKTNWIGLITIGLLAPQGNIDIGVDYK